MPQNHQILEETANTIIVGVSETEIGKVILPPTFQLVDASTGIPIDFLNVHPTMENEIAALQFANKINDLLPKFLRQQTWQNEDGKVHEMMVMERLYPLPYTHFSVPIRKLMMEIFRLKMKELYENGFVHGDFERPTNFFNRGDRAWMFQNIIQTESGLRLIDTGFAKIRGKVSTEEFVHTRFREREEIDDFSAYYLSL
jgi:hypothetical protein